MPHIKFEKSDISLKTIWESPPAFSFRIEEKDISFKYDASYFEKEGKEVIISFIVVEGRIVQQIFVSLIEEEDIFLLKLKKNSPVLRTEGIKLLLSIIGSYLESMGLKIVFSSLNPYYEKGKFYQKHIFSGQKE